MSEYVTDYIELDESTWETYRREEIIRCRDCVNFKSDECRCRKFLLPYPSDVDGTILKGAMLMANVNPDGFCAWAERRGS